jgi:hypothetical protein
MEKYGFVYIWFDSWRKMYYIGSHWGHENDGYICSSERMRKAFKRRPEDFKRRILSKVASSKQNLLDEEYRYLSMIDQSELGRKYYNLTNHKNGHWMTVEKKAKTLKEKISLKTKEAMYRPEVRERYLEGLKTRDNRAWDPEVRAKMSASNKGKNTGKDNSKAVRVSAELRRGTNLSEEHKQKIKDTTIFKTLNNKKVSCIHCGSVGNPGNIGRYHNDRCKSKKLDCVGG